MQLSRESEKKLINVWFFSPQDYSIRVRDHAVRSKFMTVSFLCLEDIQGSMYSGLATIWRACASFGYAICSIFPHHEQVLNDMGGTTCHFILTFYFSLFSFKLRNEICPLDDNIEVWMYGCRQYSYVFLEFCLFQSG